MTEAAPTMPAAGIVKIHAHTIRVATAHRMPRALVTEPTPMIAPVIVCVVDTGILRKVAVNSVIAPAISAQNPPTGLRCVSPMPMVLTIRQPPTAVPIAIALYDAITTQVGAAVAWASRTPPAIRTAQITP